MSKPGGNTGEVFLGPGRYSPHRNEYYPLSISTPATKIRFGDPVVFTIRNHGTWAQEILLTLVPKISPAGHSRDLVPIWTNMNNVVEPGKELKFNWVPNALEASYLSMNWPYKISVENVYAEAYDWPFFDSTYFQFYQPKKTKTTKK